MSYFLCGDAPAGSVVGSSSSSSSGIGSSRRNRRLIVVVVLVCDGSGNALKDRSTIF